MKKKPSTPAASVGLRRRAEQQLRKQRGEKGRARIEADAQRLVHELQVHQVELQMQNAELQEARARTDVLLEKYADLYDFAPVGYFSLSASSRIELVNLSGARLIGIERSRLVGQPFEQYLAADLRPAFRAFLKRVFAGEARQSCEVRLASAGRLPRMVNIEASRAPELPECRVVVMDLTDRKRAEEAQRRVESLAAANQSANREITHRRAVEKTLRESELTQRELLAESRELHTQLRHLTRQILLAQEAERKTISRQLHDEIAQVLAGITVQLAALTGADAIPPGDLRRRIGRAQRLVGESIDVVHRFARELRPAMLDDLGLIPALRAYIRDLPGRKGLRIQFTAFAGVEALDNIRRTMLYRVAQEALINVIRHAYARHVTVRIRSIGGIVSLVVHDDGKSFPVDRMLVSNTRKRLGLLGMRERVELVGGEFSVKSTPGHGTTVRAEIPFRDPARRAPS